MPESLPARPERLARSGVSTPGARIRGLDGLRALAIGLVLIYHLLPGTVDGGFVGVDVFFVLSGFLITRLLLREQTETGRIDLGRFWVRRARRLVPALAAVLLVCSSAAALVGGDVLVGLGGQLFAVATSWMNWRLIGISSDYFGGGAPELFRNCWSLAVEEQFYLLWPFVVLLTGRWSPRLRIAVVLAAGAASAVLMSVLAADAGLERAYYGTDTHGFGLLIGAALALAAHRAAGVLTAVSGVFRAAAASIGVIALAGIVLLAVQLREEDPGRYSGGMQAVAALTAVVIATLFVPGSPLGGLLDLGVLRWVGRRSYGLYLWHWPVLVLLQALLPTWERTGAAAWPLGLLALAITVAAAWISFRAIEQPVLTGRVLRRRRAPAPEPAASLRRRRAWLVTVSVLAATGVVATGLAVRADPGSTEAQRAIAAVAAAPVSGPASQHRAQAVAGPRSPQPAPASASPKWVAEGPTPTPTATPTPDATPTAAAAPTPDATPTPNAGSSTGGPVDGRTVTALGDSVMLASSTALQARLPGIAVDAEVSRSVLVAPDLLSEQRSTGRLRPIVVVALGTNGPVHSETLDQVYAAIGPGRRLLLVTAAAPRWWIPEANSTMTSWAARHPDVALVDWHSVAEQHLSALVSDQIHPNPIGARLYADLIATAVRKLD